MNRRTRISDIYDSKIAGRCGCLDDRRERLPGHPRQTRDGDGRHGSGGIAHCSPAINTRQSLLLDYF